MAQLKSAVTQVFEGILSSCKKKCKGLSWGRMGRREKREELGRRLLVSFCLTHPIFCPLPLGPPHSAQGGQGASGGTDQEPSFGAPSLPSSESRWGLALCPGPTRCPGCELEAELCQHSLGHLSACSAPSSTSGPE